MKRLITTVEEIIEPKGVIRVNLPLMIQLLEYARTQANNSAEVYSIGEALLDMTHPGEVLTTENFSEIVGTDAAFEVPTVGNVSMHGNVWCGNVTPM